MANRTFTISADIIKLDPKAFNKRVLTDFADSEIQNTLASIRRNVSQGQNQHKRKLKRYSKSYREAIKKGQVRGANGVRKVSVSPTNLTVSGTLLGSMQAKRNQSKVEATIEFTGRHSKAKLSNLDLARALHEKGFTGWFEFGKDDLRRIETNLGKLVDKITKNLIDIKRKGA